MVKTVLTEPLSPDLSENHVITVTAFLATGVHLFKIPSTDEILV